MNFFNLFCSVFLPVLKQFRNSFVTTFHEHLPQNLYSKTRTCYKFYRCKSENCFLFWWLTQSTPFSILPHFQCHHLTSRLHDPPSSLSPLQVFNISIAFFSFWISFISIEQFPSIISSFTQSPVLFLFLFTFASQKGEARKNFHS